jgi:hypothetical protein
MNTLTEEQQKQFEKLKDYVSPFKLDRIGETRIIYTEPLREAIQVSQTLGFNQDGTNIPLHSLDISKAHVATLIVEDHKQFKQIAGEDIESPKHHRVLLQLNQFRSEEPIEAYFDILDSMWSALPLASEYVKTLQQLHANKQQILTKLYETKNGSDYQFSYKTRKWAKQKN